MWTVMSYRRFETSCQYQVRISTVTSQSTWSRPHEVRIFIQTWFVCIKCPSSGAFAGISVTNSASNPVGQGFVALHCDCTYRLCQIAETACRLQSRIHGVSVRADRQTDTSGCVSALASCKFIDIHILRLFHITGNRSTEEQRPGRATCNIFLKCTILCTLHSHQLFKKSSCSSFTKHKISHCCALQMRWLSSSVVCYTDTLNFR